MSVYENIIKTIEQEIEKEAQIIAQKKVEEFKTELSHAAFNISKKVLIEASSSAHIAGDGGLSIHLKFDGATIRKEK